MAPQQMTV